MQRINRQSTAPFGLAFIFLGLAIVPVSLKAVGINISFAPRLSAVASAWNRITGGFTGGYQPMGTTQLSSLNFSDCCTDQNFAEQPENQPCEMACLQEQVEPADCEQMDNATENFGEPRATAVKPASREIAKRNVVASFKSQGWSGRKFAIPVIDVESVVEPIVASQTELASLVEKRMGRYRFYMKSFKAIDTSGRVKVLFEASPLLRTERDSIRRDKSEKDCDFSKKPEKLRTLLPVAIERTETRGA